LVVLGCAAITGCGSSGSSNSSPVPQSVAQRVADGSRAVQGFEVFGAHPERLVGNPFSETQARVLTLLVASQLDRLAPDELEAFRKDIPGTRQRYRAALTKIDNLHGALLDAAYKQNELRGLPVSGSVRAFLSTWDRTLHQAGGQVARSRAAVAKLAQVWKVMPLLTDVAARVKSGSLSIHSYKPAADRVMRTLKAQGPILDRVTGRVDEQPIADAINGHPDVGQLIKEVDVMAPGGWLAQRQNGG
jgi:hypothetical protein